jgi:hypothetical protein
MRGVIGADGQDQGYSTYFHLARMDERRNWGGYSREGSFCFVRSFAPRAPGNLWMTKTRAPSHQLVAGLLSFDMISAVG